MGDGGISELNALFRKRTPFGFTAYRSNGEKLFLERPVSMKSFIVK